MKLAINGGEPIRTKVFPSQLNYDLRERKAVERVFMRGRFTGYQGNVNNFKGGVEVQELEKEWCKAFGVKYAIPCNSATSGLELACEAVGISRGDKVIVSPYSMTCSATVPLLYGAQPIFCDIEDDYYCLDPEKVAHLIQIHPTIKGMIVVDLFGQPFAKELREIAHEHGIWIIEDAAQAPGACVNTISEGGYTQEFTGTLGDIGVFSLNQGKHMTAGEGGIVTTNDPKLALRARLLMNHAEAVVNNTLYLNEDFTAHDLGNSYRKLVGHNFRMTEIQAALARAQLEKFPNMLNQRLFNAEYLANGLTQIPAISSPKVRKGCVHTFYAHAFKWDSSKAKGLHRDKFIEAVKAEITPMADREDEGVRMGCGYIKPIYRMPIFDHQYELPVVERLYKDELFLHLYVAPPTSMEDMDDIITAFHKVWNKREEL